MNVRMLCFALLAIILAHPSVLRAEEKEPKKKVDWDNFDYYTEENYFEILESMEYGAQDKIRAVLRLCSSTMKPGLSTLKRLLNVKFSESEWDVQHGTLLVAPYILDMLPPNCRKEGTIILRDYCYSLLPEKDTRLRYCAAMVLVKIGDFVPVIEIGNPYEYERFPSAITLLRNCAGYDSNKPSRKNRAEFDARAKVEYRAFLVTLTYSACGLDWKPKLEPGDKIKCKIGKQIKQLGSDVKEERTTAKAALLEIGIRAFNAISTGTKHKDEEIRASCEELLKQYPFTIPARAEGFVQEYHLDRDVRFLAALLDVKDEALQKAAHPRLRKITGAELPAERKKWDKWASENTPYAEWNDKEKKYTVIEHAKESKAHLSRWNLIPKEKREKWAELEDSEKKDLIEKAEEKIQESIQKEEESRKSK
jgi:hypothetical protein